MEENFMKNRTVYSRNNKLNCETEVRAAIYCRLSKDDNLDSESESIQNQRKPGSDHNTRNGVDLHNFPKAYLK